MSRQPGSRQASSSISIRYRQAVPSFCTLLRHSAQVVDRQLLADSMSIAAPARSRVCLNAAEPWTT